MQHTAAISADGKHYASFGLTAVLIAAPPAAALVEGKTYALDPGHKELRFIWNHAGVSEQGGRCNKVGGTVAFDPTDIGATQPSVTIDWNSVNTGDLKIRMP